MRITDSSILLGSKREYQSFGRSRAQASGSSFGGLAGSLYARQKDMYNSSRESYHSAYSYTSTGQGYAYGGITGSKELDVAEVKKELLEENEQPTRLQYNLLDLLMRRFMKSGKALHPSNPTGSIRQLQPGMSSVTFQSTPTTLTERVFHYQEEEDTEFEAQGIAYTEDGREIDFRIAIEMSRSYMEYMDFNVPMLAASLADPLVVNIGTETAEVTDQTFRFDLDADGTEEEVAMLGRGSGFLALDKNGDGKINDGSELFGTRSGDGFADLRAYDSDGNGWIDENDEIFDKLKVWCKNAAGEDVLMNLKEADVGAVFLGETATEFSLYGENGAQNGQVRSTGVFLKESGGVGTVQHVDLATYDPSQVQQYLDARLRGTDKVRQNKEEQASFGLQSEVVLQFELNGRQAGNSQNASGRARKADSGNQDSKNRQKEREEAVKKADFKSMQKKIRLERDRMMEAMAKRRAEQKRIAKELADEQFAKKQSLEDARLEQLFEDREKREEFFEMS